MRGVFLRRRRVAVAWMLILVLLAPSVFASDTSGGASLWAEFIGWLAEGNGVSTAEDGGFTAWLMARIGVGNG
jgi:hypothetical protein